MYLKVSKTYIIENKCKTLVGRRINKIGLWSVVCSVRCWNFPVYSVLCPGGELAALLENVHSHIKSISYHPFHDALGYFLAEKNCESNEGVFASGEAQFFFFFFFNKFFFFNLFIIYLFMSVLVFVSVRGLSLVAASGGHSSSRCAGLSLS